MRGLERRHVHAVAHASPSQSLLKDFSFADSCSASRAETPPSSSSIQLSCAAAMSANAARPLRVRLTKEVRRSPLRCERATKPSDDEPVDDAGDVAVRHHEEARNLAHQHAVGLAIERRHHVEARQRGVELRLQPLARHAFDQPAGAQQPDPQPQPRLAVGLAAARGNGALTMSRLPGPRWPGR